jgi:hypothetical protein
MAFAPWNVKIPEGPLDNPRIIEPIPKNQPDYWVIQARKCFGAARDFADLLKACQSANALVDSPIVGWATYIVAWCGAFNIHNHYALEYANRFQLNTVISSRTWILIVH